MVVTLQGAEEINNCVYVWGINTELLLRQLCHLPLCNTCIYYFSAFMLATKVRQSKHGKVFLQKHSAYVGFETYLRQ